MDVIVCSGNIEMYEAEEEEEILFFKGDFHVNRSQIMKNIIKL